MRAFAHLLPFVLLGCTGSDDTSPTGDDDDDLGCLSDPLAVEIGTGTSAFEPLSTGADIIMVHGPQGGWHIDVGGRVSNTEELVEIDAVFTDASGVQIAGDQQPVRQALVGWDEEGCSGDFYGARIFVDDLSSNVGQEDICGLANVALKLELTITVLEADPPVSVTETLDVTAALDPIDEEPCSMF